MVRLISMEQINSTYRKTLSRYFSVKQKRNPRYSLRAFSRDLGIDSSTLGQILKGKRDLPTKLAQSIAEKLSLNAAERTLFIESLYRSKTSLDNIKINLDGQFILDESYFHVLAEWEHYAVLCLFEIPDFQKTYQHAAERLSISPERAKLVFENLIHAELLEKNEDGSLSIKQQILRTTEDVKSAALKRSHLESLNMGKSKLEEIDIELRDFSSMTIAIDPEKNPEIKTIIREFRQKLETFVKNDEKKEVYHLAIQFYPMTNVSRKDLQ